jgi:hypothetical protein
MQTATAKPITRNGMIAMLWPVYGYGAPHSAREYVATFLNYGDAVSFVGASERNLYIGEPRYDHLAREQFTDCVGDPLLGIAA